ncbi:isocitrate lyase/phosphoenolpyruvate mutase family protein [Luteimicrobium sp. NPDC057192]|uniref:isocitrate lyase/PEP mutase family protein n=1 Tax=Luteimicrobium sp. NPDC057192 TaxID=3346042 RepID=UPI0036328D7F
MSDASTTFRRLHEGPGPLLLPNAWDVGSALAFVAAGFPAVGTTSFGVGAAAGHPDGRGASRDATVALVARLRGLPVPLSVDVEDGYSADPDDVAAFVARLDVAGVNLEDSAGGALVDPEVPAAKIAAIRAATPDVFVNARVDTYWFHQSDTVDATLARARRYVEAGADGVFVPGLADPDAIPAVAAALDVPVNLLPVPGLTVDDLGALGVRRVSTGSLPYRAAIDAGVAAATRLRDGAPPVAATPYAEAQARLEAFEDGTLGR